MEEAVNTPTSTQEFCLRWNNFHSSLVSAFDGFKNESDFVDVTLACEGQFIKAHKMLLSACSVFFRDLLKANPCQHPIVILPPDVKFVDLERMMRFIYQGEVNVLQDHLPRFLKTAEMLKIRGLAEENEKKKILQCPSPKGCDSGSGSERDNVSVIPKRPRLSTDGFSGTTSENPKTPIDDSSQMSGPDSDSEMIPVKQEMIEFKECDFEGVECESFFSDGFIKLNSATTSSAEMDSSTHTNAPPPPPGSLLPSYVPPMQVKPVDDYATYASQDDLYQGSEDQMASDSPETRVEGDKSAGSDTFNQSTPKSSLSSSNRRVLLPKNISGNRNSATSNKSSPAGSTSSSPASPHPLGGSPSISSLQKSIDSKRSPSQLVSSPNQSTTSSFPNLSSTGSSRSIWHPPISAQSEEIPKSIPEAVPQGASLATLTLTPVALSCDICSKTFTSRSNLNKHKRVQHSGEEYMCPICKRTFKNRYYIKDHVNICAFPNKKSPSNSRSPLEPSPNLRSSWDHETYTSPETIDEIPRTTKENEFSRSETFVHYSNRVQNLKSPSNTEASSGKSHPVEEREKETKTESNRVFQ